MQLQEQAPRHASVATCAASSRVNSAVIVLLERLRPDAVTETDRRDAFQAIAPAVDNGLYLVPKVIE